MSERGFIQLPISRFAWKESRQLIPVAIGYLVFVVVLTPIIALIANQATRIDELDKLGPLVNSAIVKRGYTTRKGFQALAIPKVDDNTNERESDQ